MSFGFYPFHLHSFYASFPPLHPYFCHNFSAFLTWLLAFSPPFPKFLPWFPELPSLSFPFLSFHSPITQSDFQRWLQKTDILTSSKTLIISCRSSHWIVLQRKLFLRIAIPQPIELYVLPKYLKNEGVQF